MNRQLADALERLPDDVVPVVLIFMYPDGKAAMQPFSSAWQVMSQLTVNAAKEMLARAEAEALLKRH